MVNILLDDLSSSNYICIYYWLPRLKPETECQVREGDCRNNAGEKVNTVVIQQHGPTDMFDPLPGDLHYLPSPLVSAWELETGPQETVHDGSQEAAQTAQDDDPELGGGPAQIWLERCEEDPSVVSQSHHKSSQAADYQTHQCDSSIGSPRHRPQEGDISSILNGARAWKRTILMP